MTVVVIAKIIPDATLSSTDAGKTANTPSIKAYIDNSFNSGYYAGNL
jgi:hypothetical protein